LTPLPQKKIPGVNPPTPKKFPGTPTLSITTLQVYARHFDVIHRGVYYSYVKIFNKLPQYIFKYCKNTHTFKALLRDFLIKNALYSIEEFLSVGHNNVDI
jgi:hypothetical protein